MIPKCLLISILTILFCSILDAENVANAQNGEQEVFLQFRHQNVVNTYVSALYQNDEFYLSVNEIFDALQIDLETDRGNMVLQGNYIGRGQYTIDLNTQRATFTDREINFTADDFIISELGFYLHPDLIYDLLSLEFIVDFNNLSIFLETDDIMPVVAQRERERRRERLSRTQQELTRSFDPLAFDRNPSILDGGFLDYNFTANINPGTTSNYLYNTNIGTELLGGDLQGAVFGSYSQSASVLRSSGLRWRYGIRDNNWISTITAGQTTMDGFAPAAISGISITNEPIEPRFIYGETAFTGSAEPNAEVELYRNNTLVDFTEADGSGSYRFTVPITYGTSQYSIRIYSPTGEMIQRDARLQIPFNFLPPGEITYTLNAGRLDNPIAGSTERGLTSRGNVSSGLTNWLTASGGVEYFEDFHDQLPTFTGTLSSRFFTNYLISLQAANDAFYRASASVIYPSNASLNLDYTKYNTMGGIYNSSRNQSSWRVNLFTPFQVGSLPLFLRWALTSEQRDDNSIYRYRVDFNTRIGRTNLRIGYRDTQSGRLEFDTTPTARVNFSGTYNFGRTHEIPQVLRGVFLRSQINLIPAISEIEDVELQLSRNIFDRGRFQISAGRNFIGNFNQFRFTLTLDFNRFRTNSSFRSSRNTSTVSQSIRGSVGFDSNHNTFLLSNRQQAGRAGIAVRTFVDNNNNGIYDENEDDLIPENAVRIDRAGGNSFSKNGINYISQLQPYRQYNMSVNKSALNNPLLVPDLERFSLITDPNQYKLIEIPFYTSGIIDGMVYRDRFGRKEGLGGVRLYLTQINAPEGVEIHSEELRTFSDGSFYSYEIPPGDYQLEVDPSQLDFLDVVTEDEPLEFTVRALAQGDFVENLEINLIPEDQQEREQPVLFSSVLKYYNINVDSLNTTQCKYGFQIGRYSNFTDSKNFTDLAAQRSGLSLDLLYESEERVYIPQTSNLFSISELDVALQNIRSFVEPDDFVLISKCGDEIESVLAAETPQNYSIQLGSFSNENNAREFARELENNDDLDTMIEYDPDMSAYRVSTTPITGQAELAEMFQKVESIPTVENSYIQSQSSSQQPDEETDTRPVRLQLATFPSLPLAAAYTKSINEAFNIGAYIQRRDGEELYDVMSEKEFDQEELNQILEEIDSSDEFEKPIARRSEVRTESSTEISSSVIDLAESDPLPDGISLDEYLEEAGLEKGFDTSTYSYSVQIGSFQNLLNAVQLQIEFKEKFDTEISLYFNENTNLYALRTNSYSSIIETVQKINSFKGMDPYNQFAIVVQDSGLENGSAAKKTNYVIPLSQYLNEDRANSVAFEFESDTGIRTTVRKSNSNDYYTVYAGPFENYRNSEVAREVLSRAQPDKEFSVIVDPETKNRFDFHFQLHLGAYESPAIAVETAQYIEDNSNQTPVVSVDFLGYIHLLEPETFNSWSAFLQFVQEMNVYQNLNINYMIFE